MDELERVARRLRREDREHALLRLVDIAVLYHEEMQRDDRAHFGRLSKRELALVRSIDFAHDAIH